MKNKKRLVIIVILITVLLAIIGIITKLFYDAYNYKESILPSPKTSAETNKPDKDQSSPDYKKDINASSNVVTVLILGIDQSDNRTLGVYRADINAVVRINLETNLIKVLNIPRDTYTFIPIENKKDKITHAYAFGSIKDNGPQASIDAVNNFFGQDIVDYFVTVNLDAVPRIVDGLGGVEVYVDTRMDDTDADVTIEEGNQILNGKKAVTYLQWRYTSGGDLDRIKHFQNFLSAMYKQVKDKNQAMDLVGLVLKENKGIQMNLTTKQIMGFAGFFKQLPDNNVTYYNLNGNSEMINSISYWVPGDNTEVFKEFLAE